MAAAEEMRQGEFVRGDFEEAGNTLECERMLERSHCCACWCGVCSWSCRRACAQQNVLQAEYKSVQGLGECLSEGEILWNIKTWKILCVFM